MTVYAPCLFTKTLSLIECSNLLNAVTEGTERNKTFPGVLNTGEGRKPAKIRSRNFWKNPMLPESRPSGDHDAIFFERIVRDISFSNLFFFKNFSNLPY